MSEYGNVVSEFQYAEDLEGVYTINKLLEDGAKQLRVKEDIGTFVCNKTDGLIKAKRHDWVTIYNYILTPASVHPVAVQVISLNGDTYNVNINTLFSCFDKIAYDEHTNA